MTTTLEKEWAAVRGDKILAKKNSKEELLEEIRDQGLSKSDYEIVALAKSHSSMFV